MTSLAKTPEAKVEDLQPGQILLLENTASNRRDRERPGFAARLAALADIYVNDAFGVAHRPTPAPPAWLQTHRLRGPAAGEGSREPDLGRHRPGPALVVVLGGARFRQGRSDRPFFEIADQILIGGAMCFPFYKAQGHAIGGSLCHDDDIPLAREALRAAAGIVSWSC